MRENIVHILAICSIVLIRNLAHFPVSIAKRLPFIKKETRESLGARRKLRYLRLLNVYYFVLGLFGVKNMPIKEPKKYIFCRPQGGLNDMLSSIDYCVSYALRYQRVIYIDGTRGGFLDSFDRYFAIPQRERERVDQIRQNRFFNAAV
ncbi:MAG: hypothetical protein LBQ52_00710 [Helicobacteraceae bacterium]|jgi:hypothetical protein|nr:hypothetical protein [Helicobacteraceae bacterium]